MVGVGVVLGGVGYRRARNPQVRLINPVERVDLEVLAAAVGWLASGHKALLVTVVRTLSSSPRPEGSMLALRGDGHVVGSVYGGCIEDHLIEKVRRAGIKLATCQVLTYGISLEEAKRFGLPCGGTLELVAEPLSADSEVPALFGALLSGRMLQRRLDLVTGRVTLIPTTSPGRLGFDGTDFITYHGPRFRLLLIGAGPVGLFLSQIALGLDFDVTVCDPREECQEGWHPPGVRMLRATPGDAMQDVKVDERCAVVALTQDPELDDLVLLEALKSKAFFVGVLGSLCSDNARRARLAENFGMSKPELARLHSPVGIAIGSRTPAEIAVSIAAAIIAVRSAPASS